MQIGFFLREALRSLRRNAVPSFAAMATVLVTMLTLGVFIPIVQATTGAANEVRSRVMLDVYLKSNATPTDTARVRGLLERTDNVKSVTYVSKAQAYKEQRQRNPEAYELLGSTRCPTPSASPPTTRGRSPRSPTRSRPRPRAVSARSPIRRSTTSTTARTTRRRSSRRPGREVHDGGPRRAARARLGAADREHDPALALRAPARGRGHEARGRDRLVHPLAVSCSRA